jgi:hypothetical protein
MPNRFASLALLASILAVNPLGLDSARAQDTDGEDVLESLEQVKSDLTTSRHLLRYKYQPGETISYTVEHLVSIDTTIAGNNQKTKLRTKSVRSLQVDEVSDK